jgi:ribosomal protein S18 acetylase RimI-like enzyme
MVPSHPTITRSRSITPPLGSSFARTPITSQAVAPLDQYVAAIAPRPDGQSATAPTTALVGKSGKTVKVQLSVLSEKHVDGVAKLVSESFLGDEPMTATLRLKMKKAEGSDAALVETMRGFTREVVAQAAKDGLSFVVTNESGQPVACSINERYSTTEPPPEVPALAPVFELLGQHAESFIGRHGEKAEGAFHIFMVATDAEHTGMGLAKKVVEGSLARAREQAVFSGTPLVVTEATSNSQGVFARFGFQPEHEVVYASQPAFAGMDEAGQGRGWPQSSKLMVLDLGVNLPR